MQYALVYAMAGVLGWLAHKRVDGGLRKGWAAFLDQAARLVLVMPLALITAGFLSVLLPLEAVADLLGPGSGFIGVLIATAAGAAVPGGPFISFPVVLILAEGGAGVPQLVAFLTAWSVLALFRVFQFEIPMMGSAFALLRLIASMVTPFVAAAFAWAIMAFVP